VTQAERCTPGPGHYNADGSSSSDPHALGSGKPVSAMGGPSFTMGARTKPAGQSLQEREAAMAPGPGAADEPCSSSGSYLMACQGGVLQAGCMPSSEMG